MTLHKKQQKNWGAILNGYKTHLATVAVAHKLVI